MSHHTLRYEVRIDREQLLNLFLGHGDLVIPKEDQTIVLNIINRQFSSGEGNKEIHIIEIDGVSDDPRISCIRGTGVLKPVAGAQGFTLSLEMHLEDHYE